MYLLHELSIYFQILAINIFSPLYMTLNFFRHLQPHLKCWFCCLHFGMQIAPQSSRYVCGCLHREHPREGAQMPSKESLWLNHNPINLSFWPWGRSALWVLSVWLQVLSHRWFFAIIWVLSLSTSEENCDFIPFPLLSLIIRRAISFFPQVISKLCCKTDVHVSWIDCSIASAKCLS